MQSTTTKPFLLKTIVATLNLLGKGGGKQLSKEGIFKFLKRITNRNWIGNANIPGATV